MTYVVTEACIKCKYMECIEVCPTDCFREGKNMVVIEPDACIDCGVCEPLCPIQAIEPDINPDMSHWVEFNKKYARIWPIILKKGTPPEDADVWATIKDKKSYFSEEPGNYPQGSLSGSKSTINPPHNLTPKCKPL